MTAERIMHTHARAITVRHVEAQPASGPRPAMPEHYVTELDGQPLCWIPASALAPLLAEAEARGAREAAERIDAERLDRAVRQPESTLSREEQHGWSLGMQYAARLARAKQEEAAVPEQITTAFPMTTNYVLRDAFRYHAERQAMADPKGWAHVQRKYEQALAGDLYRGATDTERLEARYILAALAEAEREALALPEVAHKGPHDTDRAMFNTAATRLRNDRPVGGSNVRTAVARLIERALASAEQAGDDRD